MRDGGLPAVEVFDGLDIVHLDGPDLDGILDHHAHRSLDLHRSGRG